LSQILFVQSRTLNVSCRATYKEILNADLAQEINWVARNGLFWSRRVASIVCVI